MLSKFHQYYKLIKLALNENTTILLLAFLKVRELHFHMQNSHLQR